MLNTIGERCDPSCDETSPVFDDCNENVSTDGSRVIALPNLQSYIVSKT